MHGESRRTSTLVTLGWCVVLFVAAGLGGCVSSGGPRPARPESEAVRRCEAALGARAEALSSGGPQELYAAAIAFYREATADDGDVLAYALLLLAQEGSRAVGVPFDEGQRAALRCVQEDLSGEKRRQARKMLKQLRVWRGVW